MGTFIGREHELSQLERIYGRENMKTCMVYGRRRIGKSALLRRFCQDKRHLMVQFVRSSSTVNTDILADAVSEITGTRPDPLDLHHVLDSIVALCRAEKTVVVFDEIPYLLEDETAKTEMQRFVDSVSASTDSMLVICGSSISFMTDEVLRRSAPVRKVRVLYRSGPDADIGGQAVPPVHERCRSSEDIPHSGRSPGIPCIGGRCRLQGSHRPLPHGKRQSYRGQRSLRHLGRAWKHVRRRVRGPVVDIVRIQHIQADRRAHRPQRQQALQLLGEAPGPACNREGRVRSGSSQIEELRGYGPAHFVLLLDVEVFIPSGRRQLP